MAFQNKALHTIKGTTNEIGIIRKEKITYNDISYLVVLISKLILFSGSTNKKPMINVPYKNLFNMVMSSFSELCYVRL